MSLRPGALVCALAVALGCTPAPGGPAVERVLAARAGAALEPRPGLALEEAYAVQLAVTRRLLARGERLAGYKIAFTSEGAQREWGVGAPAHGPLLASMRLPADGGIPAGAFRAPRAEVEVAFEIGARIDAPLEAAALRAAVRAVRVALELADVRFAPGRHPAAADVVADGAGARAYALGPAHTPEAVHPGTACALRVDGRVVSRAPARDALGDPWNALAWLTRDLASRGRALEPGHVVLTGALGRVWAPGPARPARLEARCDGLGRVAVSLR